MKYLLNRTGALGDVLELTAITRRLHDLGHEAHVKTNYPQVFAENPDCMEINSRHDFDYFDHVIDLNMAFENDLRRLHPIDSYSARVFNDHDTPKKIYFNFPKATVLKIDNHFIDGPIAVVHPARSWPIRTLSHKFWQDLVYDLGYHFTVTLTGTGQDHGGLTNCLDLRGQLSLAQQASLIDYCDVFICSESGPMILAQATTTPIIALTTMVDPARIIHTGANITCILAAVPCVGCESKHEIPQTYLDCPKTTLSEFRACVRDGAFDPTHITSVAKDLTKWHYS